MIARFLILGCALIAMSGCTPLVVGGAAAVGADAIAEDRNGGDGLF